VGAESKLETVGITELVDKLYGPRGVIMVRVFLIAYQIGKGTAYLIFFIQFFSYVMSDASEEQETGDWIYLILALCIVVPMGFIDNMALFTKFSIIANLLTWFGLLSVIGTLSLASKGSSLTQ
jgi:proton-coupled amino acid transporter